MTVPPAASPLARLSRVPVTIARAALRRLSRWGRHGGLTGDVLESAAALDQFLGQVGLPPLVAAPAAAGTPAGAARFVLGTLLGSPLCRLRFPDALTAGPSGGFARYCAARVPEEFAQGVREVFNRDMACGPERLWQTRRDLRAAMPSALLPAGRAAFLRWLLAHGVPDDGVTVEECLWWAFESAENPFAGVAATYRAVPEWKQAHPHALTREGWPAFRDWVAGAAGLSPRWLARVPAPTVAVPPPGVGVNLVAPLRITCGLRQFALTIRDMVRDAGQPVAENDIVLNGPTDLCRRGELMDGEPFATSVFVLGLDTDPRLRIRMSGLAERAPARRVGVLFWEAERVPESMAGFLDPFQEVWASTRFMAEAFRPATTAPVHVMLPSVELAPFERVGRAELGLAEDEYVFAFVFDLGSSLSRKNPAAAVEAFARATRPGDRARLVLKTHHARFRPDDFARLQAVCDRPGVTLIEGDWPHARVLALMDAADCYVSLHRAEGLGLTMAESMLLGKPVIATGYSGNTDFMTVDNSLLVDYKRVVSQTHDVPYPAGVHWADPSVEHAAAWMRWALDNRDAAKSLGGRARADLRQRLSHAGYRHRLLGRLAEIRRERGG